MIHGMAWQSAQTKVQVKWSSIFNGLHIDGTPHQLFGSLSFRDPTILNVVKNGKRVKQMKTTYLGKLNESGNKQQQFRKILMSIYWDWYCSAIVIYQQQFKHFNCCYHDADDMNKLMQF